MVDGPAPAPGETLQFERVTSSKSGVQCAGCHQTLTSEYYDINGKSVCPRCRTAIEHAADTPRGAEPFVRAAIFGLGAALLGAAIYYAVIAIAHLEIGIIAILSGYLVGRAVRAGAGGRGGLRFQILALVLTYLSVAFAYTPVAVSAARQSQTRTQQTPTSPVAPDPPRTPPRFNPLAGVAILFGVIAALPVLVVVGSLPSGLLSGLIIGIGMRQAWRMTGAPSLQIFGPYKIGAGGAIPQP